MNMDKARGVPGESKVTKILKPKAPELRDKTGAFVLWFNVAKHN
jgi:hypothetical protein